MVDGSQKSILLLGGSRQQVVAIKTAKRLGYRTVLCDYLPDNPGQYFADVFYHESTTDRAKMLEIARREAVSGVLAYSSDPAAPTAAYVAEKLGLPTNPLASVEILSEKHLFRKHLRECGLPCPKAVPVSANATPLDLVHLSSTMSRPVVLKPTDSSGSKGISVLPNPDVPSLESALDHARQFSRNGTLMLEEFISASFPRVVGGDVFIVDGKVEFWGIMSCLRDKELGGLVPIGERNPSGLSAAQLKRCKDVIQMLVDSLGLQFGELNVEIIIGKDGVPYFLELGARAGGNMIPVQLSDISGIDLVEANVRFAMGDTSMSVAFEGNDKPVCSFVLHASRDGRFCGVRYDESIEPYVYREVMYVEQGDAVSVFDGANKALGIVFLRFDDASQMEDALDRIGELIVPLVC